MMTPKHFFTSLLAGSFALALFSCNNSTETVTATTDSAKIDTTKAATATAAAATPAMPALTVPFDVVEITEVLKDYAAWKPKFDSNSTARAEAGLETIVLAQVIDKPTNVEIVMKVTDVQKTKDLYDSPKMKEVMKAAGVLSKPSLQFLHVIRFNPDSHEKQWVEVTHKVKDFEAWLKVYDGEGKEKRMAEGMVDVVLARGISDSSLVQLIFDITDMAKAKAALASVEKKKIMTSAGVQGIPKIIFYKFAE